MPDSSATTTRRWRERLAGTLPPVKWLTCETCSRPHYGSYGPLCSVCWRKTPEGRARRAEQRRKQRRGSRQK